MGVAHVVSGRSTGIEKDEEHSVVIRGAPGTAVALEHAWQVRAELACSAEKRIESKTTMRIISFLNDLFLSP